MKNRIRISLAAILTAALLCIPAFSASAAEQKTVADAQAEAISTLSDLAKALPSANNFLPDAVSQKRVTAITRLSDEEVEAISGRLAEHSKVYLVELQDGHYTYYMAVDFRNDDAVYFSKLAVMRATSHKLYDRSVQMEAQDKPEGQPLLMSYTHIIGELSLHYVVYRVTDALGGEKLPGLMGKLYRNSAVADLNVDEGRMAAAIRLVGKILG